MGERRSEKYEVNGGSAAAGDPGGTATRRDAAYDRGDYRADNDRAPSSSFRDREREYMQRPDDEKSPDAIARDIRRTRAEMSETVNAIERKLSPERLRHELKESMHDGIDTLKEQFNPRRMARETGKNMLETIKENPLPSLIAGLSIGWLFMKGNDHDSDNRRWEDRTGYRRGMPPRSRFEEEYDYYPAGKAAYYEHGQASGARRYDYSGRPYEEFEGDDGYERSMKDRAGDLRHRASDAADDVRHRASEVADDVRHRASELGDEVRHRASDFGHEVQYRSRRARSSIEHFIDENPLMAGAIAAGIGALVGSALPSTHLEDEWVGETRDRVVRQARDVAEHTVERSKPILEDVKQEVKQSVREVGETARQEARHVAEKAKQEASHVADTAREGARELKNEAADEVRHRT